MDGGAAARVVGRKGSAQLYEQGEMLQSRQAVVSNTLNLFIFVQNNMGKTNHLVPFAPSCACDRTFRIYPVLLAREGYWYLHSCACQP